MKILRTLTKAARNTRDFFAAERVALAPFAKDLRNYTVPKFRQDAWAAANVTVLALAQGIAFAAIAGLPVVYGITCAAVAAFASTSAFTIASTVRICASVIGSLCEKSKRVLDSSTSEPLCSTCEPKVFLRPLCNKWVAE